ncbi:monoacylglycerol lipase abhd6-like [Plakobranchus ocellatus]|uniref:Monoacylglycerol lipase abhd6-like n=1 Tax=Plakobranchus ocellatus TaxID=259542 RepID=A0AAV4B7E6_9GAST|nr:monoacylglycerol lipase abhd6-like [Plakobranchus ocellatus]
MELDTGAAVTAMTKADFMRIFKSEPQLQKTSIKLKTYTNEVITPLGQLQVKVEKGTETFYLPLLILDKGSNPILGRNWLSSIKVDWSQINKMSIDPPDYAAKIKILTSTYADVFSDGIGTIKGIQGTLVLKNDFRPKFCKARPIPYASKKKIEQELDNLERQGIISSVKSSDWATPIVPVLKANGDVRLCGDYKTTVNPNLYAEKYTLPRMEDMLAQLEQGEKFSKIDLRQAYLQLPLDEASKSITTINTSKGLYSYNRLPFGITSSPAIWQKTMDSVLQSIPGVQCNQDDMIVTESHKMEAVINLLYPELSLNPATLAIATITTMTSLYLYFIRPSMIIQAYFNMAVRWSGMKMKCIKADDSNFIFSYGEKGQQSKGQASILLLHGFTADHFMWAPIVHNIPSSVHVIALDLPGHGFSSPPLEGDDIGFMGQLKRIRQFVDLVGLSDQPFLLTGVSMGGALCGLFAAHYPNLVAAVSMTCPSMKTPIDSRMIEENRDVVLQSGGQLTLDNCPILPQTPEQLQYMLSVTHYYSGTRYPQQILKGVLKIRKKKNDHHLKLANVIITEESSTMLESNLHKIQCPTQVLWGKEDWVVHISGLDVIRNKAPNLQHVAVLEKCGHAVNLDQPLGISRNILQFWQQHGQLQVH